MTDLHEAEPCLAQARQGFSVLYKDRYLYSRYNPEDSIKKVISSLTIQSESLIFCYAPAAGYGLKELTDRCPSDSYIYTIDFDSALHSFFLEQNKDFLESHKGIHPILLEKPQDIVRLMSESELFPNPGRYRRIITVEMSGGTAFNKEEYAAVTRYADDFIMNFWKNHITLTRMGRLYALDILKNLSQIHHSKPLIKGNISKSILVLGAGLSIDRLLPALRGVRDNFFILCVDAALPALLQNGINPDAVIAVECQTAIEKAYIGAAGSGIHMIADLTSRPHVTGICGGNVSFFLSDYGRLSFLKDIKHMAESCSIPVFPSMGSVGLYTVETAFYLRAGETPVFVSGLDFSFDAGQTHCKGAPAHTASLLNASRLTPAGNPAAAFRPTAQSFTGKGGLTEYTDAALSGYCSLFAEYIRNKKNLFDITERGYRTGLPHVTPQQMMDLALRWNAYSGCCTDFFRNEVPEAGQALISEYIEEQKKKLHRIRDILTGEAVDSFDGEPEELMSGCDYLYAHFPDSTEGFRNTPDFIRRIRAEVNLFIKAAETTLP